MIHDSDQDTETATHSLTVAAVGWKHQAWCDGFYPDDMPEDWQLAFYANEFGSVLVPQSYYAGGVTELEQWLEDIPEAFSFYLQYPDDEQTQQLFAAMCKRLDHHLAGIISRQAIDGDFSVPVYMLDKTAPPAMQLWTPDTAASSGVACLTLADTSIRTWRSWLEQFSESCDGNLKALFVSDDIIDINKLQELKTLAELMGL